jgi:hypothetical protein
VQWWRYVALFATSARPLRRLDVAKWRGCRPRCLSRTSGQTPGPILIRAGVTIAAPAGTWAYGRSHRHPGMRQRQEMTKTRLAGPRRPTSPPV